MRKCVTKTSQCKNGLHFSTIKHNYFFLYGIYGVKYDADMSLTDFMSKECKKLEEVCQQTSKQLETAYSDPPLSPHFLSQTSNDLQNPSALKR